MITIFSNDHRLHFGKYELIDGQFVTPFECPKRMEHIMQRIADVKLGEVIEPQEFGLDKGLARIRDFSPDALVVSLGVDTYEKDPISKFRLKSEHFLEIGAKIVNHIACSTLFVMEGGYAVDEIGINVVNLLTGFLNG
jgi:hypothetical protein